jgi:F-type H+-transporting ATPase subunit delta
MEDELAGRLRVTIEAPAELDKKLMDELKKKLEDETKKEVILAFEKKEALIGGLVLKVGNTVLDGSLRAQLDRAKETILKGVA